MALAGVFILVSLLSNSDLAGVAGQKMLINQCIAGCARTLQKKHAHEFVVTGTVHLPDADNREALMWKVRVIQLLVNTTSNTTVEVCRARLEQCQSLFFHLRCAECEQLNQSHYSFRMYFPKNPELSAGLLYTQWLGYQHEGDDSSNVLRLVMMPEISLKITHMQCLRPCNAPLIENEDIYVLDVEVDKVPRNSSGWDPSHISVFKRREGETQFVLVCKVDFSRCGPDVRMGCYCIYKSLAKYKFNVLKPAKIADSKAMIMVEWLSSARLQVRSNHFALPEIHTLPMSAIRVMDTDNASTGQLTVVAVIVLLCLLTSPAVVIYNLVYDRPRVKKPHTTSRPAVDHGGGGDKRHSRGHQGGHQS